MTAHDHGHHNGLARTEGSFWSSRAFFVFLAFAAMAITLLWSEHRAHILGALPYLFLLACPLLHVFGGHGHGSRAGHGRHHSDDGGRS
jgi:hypothetical protein